MATAEAMWSENLQGLHENTGAPHANRGLMLRDSEDSTILWFQVTEGKTEDFRELS